MASFFILFVLLIVPASNSRLIEVTNEVDIEDCALDAAPNCLEPIWTVLNCTQFSLYSSCSAYDAILIPGTVGSVCSFADNVLNVCLVDLLGNSCSASNPKHSHYKQWQKLLNNAVEKLCSIESRSIIAESSMCINEDFFYCLFVNDKFEWIETVTTEISPDICSNIEMRWEMCMSLMPPSPPCTPVLDLLKDVTKDFVDNSACTQEPILFVPLSERKSTKENQETDLNRENNSDKACERDASIVSKCFEPVFQEWKCYFKSNTTGCKFSLDNLCVYATDAFELCVQDLVGYGCENDKIHKFFNEWLSVFHSVHSVLCDYKNQPSTLIQENYFSGKANCWLEFFNCMHNYQSENKLIDLLTEEITSSTCRKIADNVDYCIIPNFSQTFCDPVYDKLQEMKMAFVNSTACDDSVTFPGFKKSNGNKEP